MLPSTGERGFLCSWVASDQTKVPSPSTLVVYARSIACVTLARLLLGTVSISVERPFQGRTLGNLPNQPTRSIHRTLSGALEC